MSNQFFIIYRPIHKSFSIRLNGDKQVEEVEDDEEKRLNGVFDRFYGQTYLLFLLVLFCVFEVISSSPLSD